MNSKYTDWTDYFNAVPSSTYINKGCMKSLFNTFDATVTENEALNQVEKHSSSTVTQSLSVLLIPWFVISLFISHNSRQKYDATLPLFLRVTEPSLLPSPHSPNQYMTYLDPVPPTIGKDDSNIAYFFFQVGRSVSLGWSWRDTYSEDSHIKSALLFTFDRGDVISLLLELS